MTKVLIFGAGGLGREVLSAFRASAAAGANITCLGFLVDPKFWSEPTLQDLPVYKDISVLAHDRDIRVVVAIGDPRLRRVSAEKIEKVVGPRFISVIHPAATIGLQVKIGLGAMILGPLSLTTNISIGRHVLINPLVSISHDCRLGDYATLAPAVVVAGGVEVGEGAELGTGAQIIPRLSIGAWSIVGAGATVIHSVNANSTAVGAPAREISIRTPGWHQ